MAASKIEFDGDHRRGKLIVDGTDVSGHVLNFVSMRAEAGHIPTVEAKLLGRSVTFEVDGLLYLEVPEEVHMLLEAAGWTPPQEANDV